MVNIGIHVFFIAATTICNQPLITIKYSETIATFCKKKPTSKHICLKLHFRHKLLVVPCSKDDFYLSPFMVTQVIWFVAPLSFSFQGYRRYRSVTIIVIGVYFDWWMSGGRRLLWPEHEIVLVLQVGGASAAGTHPVQTGSGSSRGTTHKESLSGFSHLWNIAVRFVIRFYWTSFWF